MDGALDASWCLMSDRSAVLTSDANGALTIPAKRIVIFSDGTGNAASSIWHTNVWRLYQFLSVESSHQIVKYDDGIGSSSFKPFALIAGAFGYGFKRNVIDLYKFVCRSYDEKAKIYCFGFSRGAYTVRILALLLLQQGIVPYNSEDDLDRRAKEAYEALRAENYRAILPIEPLFRFFQHGIRWILNRARGRKSYADLVKREVQSIEFIGVWDTVGAYGLPIQEMTRGINKWLFRLGFDESRLDKRVKRACHAISIDDERATFHPILWTEEGEVPSIPGRDGVRLLKNERISQVWFPGAHANVGGGYPDDGLAYVPLHWLMMEARERGLHFKNAPLSEPDAFRTVNSACQPMGRQYDPRSGIGAYYRYYPRKIADLCHARLSRVKQDRIIVLWPKIHESALMRLRQSSSAYAPIGLPARYALVTFDGRILRGKMNPYETPKEARSRALAQEKIWNFVWFRRFAYYGTLWSSLYLLFFWLFHDFNPAAEFTTPLRPVSEFIRVCFSFLPSGLHWWADWYATNPQWFLVGFGTLCVSARLSTNLRRKINSEMRSIWDHRSEGNDLLKSSFHLSLYRLRTNAIYQMVARFIKYDFLPTAGVAAFLFLFWLFIMPATHLVINIADDLGMFCRESDPATLRLVNLGLEQKARDFNTSAICSTTGLRVQEGYRYEIVITVTEPWQDGSIATTPQGYLSSQLPRYEAIPLRLGSPLRRVLFRPWFRLIARVGAIGGNEYFLDPTRTSKSPQIYRDRFSAARSGELFLYTNDAVLPIPGLSDVFYRNNRGSAEITVRLL